jgi:Glycosyl hydrolase catalytic core
MRGDLRRREWLAAALSSVGAATLAACGGGGESGSTTNASSLAPAPAAGPAPAPAAPAPAAPAPSPPTAPSPSPGPAPSPTPAPPSAPAAAKSAKRGIAYALASPRDMAALAPGVSWWYGWALQPISTVPADHSARYGLDFMPMLWGKFKEADALAYLQAHPEIRYLLLLNEPNLVDQANLTPALAAELWPQYEAVAAKTGVKLVGPAMSYGTMPGFGDPLVWLDAFYAAYRASHANRDPQIDYLAFHWYDYGLKSQLDRLQKYGKPIWVTEMANWHNGDGAAQIDTEEKQKTQMSEMVALCESRADVFRYAWFTGRLDKDPHHASLLGADGELTALGRHYIALPF